MLGHSLSIIFVIQLQEHFEFLWNWYKIGFSYGYPLFTRVMETIALTPQNTGKALVSSTPLEPGPAREHAEGAAEG